MGHAQGKAGGLPFLGYFAMSRETPNETTLLFFGFRTFWFGLAGNEPCIRAFLAFENR